MTLLISVSSQNFLLVWNMLPAVLWRNLSAITLTTN